MAWWMNGSGGYQCGFVIAIVYRKFRIYLFHISTAGGYGDTVDAGCGPRPLSPYSGI
jgi:hypothetical protein